MSDNKCAPYPWVQDEYGNVKDTNGETVKLTGFALACGYTQKDDSCYVNTKMVIAAPELLEACEEFVRKVECGAARSTQSYEQMKKAIAKAKGE